MSGPVLEFEPPIDRPWRVGDTREIAWWADPDLVNFGMVALVLILACWMIWKKRTAASALLTPARRYWREAALFSLLVAILYKLW